ncbi:MAG: hypothetical protein ACRD2I_08165 [Vicinamibacterales bacterium]
MRINLTFDRAISSHEIKAAARREAAAIWTTYGVDLLFTGSDVPPALTLDVIVARDAVGPDDTPPVLGHTSIAPESAPQAPIRISFDAIDALLERRHGGNPLMHDYALAMALGRVLAHEIGHILLGAPAYHDADGLMRTTFQADDLARPERSRFLLAEHSVTRLRSRLASLAQTRAAEGCERVGK